jgi:hypothetical protein
MSGNPRENVRDQGFWDGGTPGHCGTGETSGRPNGFPGTRKPGRVGVRTDIEFPSGAAEKKEKPKT